MADYFLVHDRSTFEQQIRPALAEAWRCRSFAPCRDLAENWIKAAESYARTIHTSPDELLLVQLQRGLPFDRHFWRTIVGEVLLVTAVQIPELPAHIESLEYLLGQAIHQALHGSRDLTFGLAVYRPEHAGYNDPADVARLAEYLDSIEPELWTAADLVGLAGLETEADREEELDFAREWFVVLADLYRSCAEAGRVIILESIF